MTAALDWKSIRAENLARLSEAGFKVSPGLPVRHEASELRPVREIAQRLSALVVVFAWAAASPKQIPDADLRGRVERDGLDPFFATDERALLALSRNKAHAQHVGDVGWRLENMWPLAWTLGLPRAPSFEGAMIDDETIGEVLDFTSGKHGVDALLSRAAPRSSAEVVAMEDLFYCAHNAVRSAQLGGKTVPKGFHPMASGGVVHERRHALTWAICPGTTWDDTDLST